MGRKKQLEIFEGASVAGREQGKERAATEGSLGGTASWQWSTCFGGLPPSVATATKIQLKITRERG